MAAGSLLLGVLQDDLAVDPPALFTHEAATLRVALLQAEPEVVSLGLPAAEVGVLRNSRDHRDGRQEEVRLQDHALHSGPQRHLTVEADHVIALCLGILPIRLDL